MKIFYTIKTAMRRMPNGLRIFTTLCLIFTFFLPAAFLPTGEFFVNGDRVSFAEFWQRGGGAIFALIGLLGALLAYGFIWARSWARHLSVTSGWAIVVATFIGWHGFSLDVVFVILFCGCLPVWYFYFRRPVREYFGNHGTTEDN